MQIACECAHTCAYILHEVGVNAQVEQLEALGNTCLNIRRLRRQVHERILSACATSSSSSLRQPHILQLHVQQAAPFMRQKYAAQPPHVRYDGPQFPAVLIGAIRVHMAVRGISSINAIYTDLAPLPHALPPFSPLSSDKKLRRQRGGGYVLPPQ